MHGKTTRWRTTAAGVYAGAAAALHGDPLSLAGDRAREPAGSARGHVDARATARSWAFAIARSPATQAPLEGVQFHPESILTEHGHAMLKNFLESARNEPT